MKILVDIPEHQLEELRTICLARKLSRSEAVRSAIDGFIQRERPSRESAFGIWRGHQVVLPGQEKPLPKDGLAYQEQLRREW